MRDKRDRAITCMSCPDHVLFFAKKSVERKVKFGIRLFQTKLLLHFLHQVCHLLSSTILLRIK